MWGHKRKVGGTSIKAPALCLPHLQIVSDATDRLIMPRSHRAEVLSDDARLTSVCLSVAYLGPKSRTERPRLKLAHVTWTPLSRSKGQRKLGFFCFRRSMTITWLRDMVWWKLYTTWLRLSRNGDGWKLMTTGSAAKAQVFDSCSLHMYDVAGALSLLRVEMSNFSRRLVGYNCLI